MRLVRQKYSKPTYRGGADARSETRGAARPAPVGRRRPAPAGRRPPGSRTRRAAARAALALLTVTALATGCADGKPASGDVGPAAGQQAAELHRRQAALAAARKWGLAAVPLPAPPAPARKPRLTTREGFEVEDHEGLPPVFTTVPTRDKVVFLTIDDGAEKDPAFLRMMSELKIPYTAFLSDYLVKEDYGYFKKMQAAGVGLHNHTLRHRYMPNLSYAEQKREICGMQDVIGKRYGRRPALFRPPFGNYNEDTLRAARACGIKAVPLWNEEVFVDRWDYRELDRDLHPGDIVLSHFRGTEDWDGTMPDMVRRFMELVTAKGYAVARLEDYL